jgi:hypothetical protein
MTPIVTAPRTTRFQRRFDDYCWTLEKGTSSSVGKPTPGLPDRRTEINRAFADGIEPATAALNKVWKEDALRWPRRLSKPFLDGFTRRGFGAFEALVKAGCQPDVLALHFYEATDVDESSKDQDQVRRDLDELDRLAAQAVESLQRLVTRQQQFDEYLISRHLRILAGEPGDADLKLLLADLQELIGHHQADSKSLRRQLDGRRQPLIGHAEVRLSLRVQAATGGYHDRDVEDVLDELRMRLKQPPRSRGTLKRRRIRWAQAIGPRINEG